MVTKKISRKTRIAYNLLKDEGLIAVAIRSLEFIQKKTKRNNVNTKHKHSINTGAIYEEILVANPEAPANSDWKAIPLTKKSLTLNWIMPPPGKGSGGHMTIFRFIQYLEKAGHTCRIYLHNPGPGSSVAAVKAIMGDSFPKVNASMEWLQQDEEMQPADGIIATSWQTAYTVYATKQKVKKFYFVQDFEPYFYPVGGFYALAENTYKLGLRGITAGGWLSKKLRENYGMVTSHFSFGSDSDTYSFAENSDRKEIVFYARPTTERRAFELGVLTLDIFHQMHPEYTINFIGWDVSEFNIPFPHKNLGILNPDELNNLYNRCSASLVMSMTNMSLLPLELLSSGCIPVVTEGENNTLVSDNKFIVYSPSDPISMAKKLSETISRKNLLAYSMEASQSVKNESWDESGAIVVQTIEKSIHTDGNE